LQFSGVRPCLWMAFLQHGDIAPWLQQNAERSRSPMRVPEHLVRSRREQLSRLLSEHRYLPVAEICRRLKVSEATVRRDLASLAKEQKIQRTFGGAVAFFNSRFPPFRSRLAKGQRGKRATAKCARQKILAGMTCFLDTGTTIYLLAEEIRSHPPERLVVVTGNLSAAELLAGTPGIEVHLLGGEIVVEQAVLLGAATLSALRLWKFDLAFLSAEGMTSEGIWNSRTEIIEMQREAIGRSNHSIALLDRSKLGVTTPHLLAGWSEDLELVSDASREDLREAGIPTMPA